MTFKAYLRTVPVSETPAYDFVRDAEADRDLPNVTTWPELESYLRQRNAAREALAAAKQVWTAYEAAG